MSLPIENLGSVCTFENGDRGKNYPSKGSFVELGIPFINAGNLTETGIDENSLNFITSETFERLGSGKVKENDILFCLRGSIGKYSVVKNINKGAIASSLIIIRSGKKIDNDYLKHYLGSTLCRREIDNFENGAAQPNLSGKDLKRFKIPLPPLPEQKRIAAILDKADNLRRKRQQAITLADEFLRAVFLDMFGDPVTNPRGWKVEKLENLCGVGSSRRVFTSEFVETGVPFYRGTEVGKLGAGDSIEPDLFISDEHYTRLKSQSGAPKIGDLLLPSICHDGRIWQVDHEEPFYFKDGRVLWIKVDQDKIKSDFLRFYLKYIFLTNYSSIASGTTFAELKIVILKGLNILMPPMEVQEEFMKILKKSSENINTSVDASYNLDQLFNSLSQKAFKGEL